MRARNGKVHPISTLFGNLANIVAPAAGRPATFVLAVPVIAIWAATGPVFRYSDTWQLVIDTGT